MAIEEAKLKAFVHQAIGDLAASVSGVMTAIGHKLGLYQAMAGSGPLTPAELAQKTGTHERYVREWLNNQAAGGYVSYDPAQRTASWRTLVLTCPLKGTGDFKRRSGIFKT